jgi:hypothetical protein
MIFFFPKKSVMGRFLHQVVFTRLMLLILLISLIGVDEYFLGANGLPASVLYFSRRQASIGSVFFFLRWIASPARAFDVDNASGWWTFEQSATLVARP